MRSRLMTVFFVLMMVMMPVVTVVGMVCVYSVAFLVRAYFPGGFQLQGGVGNVQLLQLIAHLLFDLLAVAVCYDVHGNAGGLTVDTPKMNVMNIQNAINGG